MSQEPIKSPILDQKTLSEVRRERKGYEQDAILLQNRLNFLQSEESKTWTQIKKTQRMKSLVEEARRLKSEQQRKQSQVLCTYEKQRFENQQKIQQLKDNIQRNKLISRQALQNSKKQTYIEIRQMKEELLQRKIKNEEDVVKDNQKRSSSVKVERIKMSIRKHGHQEQRMNQFKEEYFKKVVEEVQKGQNLQNKISELEVLEGELIRKLQNTQSLHKQIVRDYEQMNPKPSAPGKFNYKIYF